MSTDPAAAPLDIATVSATEPMKMNTAADRNARADGDIPTYEEIAEAAYLRYLKRGGNHGGDFDDWIEAERELSSRRSR